LDQSDGDLLRRCRKGDQDAWRALVERHSRRVFGIAYRFTGRVDEAEDLTQEVFVKVYQALEQFAESEGQFAGWLAVVARNQCIDHYRRRREERQRDVGDPERLAEAASRSESPFRSLEREERAGLVHRALRALPRELREPLVLFDLEGVPYRDIATTLGLPLGTVKSRINRARIELAKRLLGRKGEIA
jgi:RNA polymerase sigma-70 factor (ECF subfamily)